METLDTIGTTPSVLAALTEHQLQVSFDIFRLLKMCTASVSA